MGTPKGKILTIDTVSQNGSTLKGRIPKGRMDKRPNTQKAKWFKRLNYQEAEWVNDGNSTK